jgi:GT2 family glycosyltransferase
MPSELPSVSVIVLNWNGRGHLAPCFESLLKLDYPADKLELILCDNGSTDGSVEFMQRRLPEIRVIALRRNYGFAEGNNRAAREATGEWLAFLNNDMRVDSSWLKHMVEPLAGNPRIASVASRIMNWDGTKIDFVGGGVGFHGHGFQLDDGAARSIQDRPRRLLFACGGAMLMRRDIFLSVGGFDPEFFAFFEDVDLGWRLNVLGYDVWYTPEAVVQHRHHGTAGRIEPHQLGVLYERNALAMIYKNYDDENLAAALPAALLLVNERALEHAKLDLSTFAVPGGQPVEAAGQRPDSGHPDVSVAVPPKPNLVQRGNRVLREQGLGTAVKKGLTLPFRLARSALLPGIDYIRPRHYLVPGMSMAYFVGISAFTHDIESLNRKRAWIQARRKRPDSKIIPLFVDPFFSNYPDPNFHRFSSWLARVQGLDKRFAISPD